MAIAEGSHAEFSYHLSPERIGDALARPWGIRTRAVAIMHDRPPLVLATAREEQARQMLTEVAKNPEECFPPLLATAETPPSRWHVRRRVRELRHDFSQHPLQTLDASLQIVPVYPVIRVLPIFLTQLRRAILDSHRVALWKGFGKAVGKSALNLGLAVLQQIPFIGLPITLARSENMMSKVSIDRTPQRIELQVNEKNKGFFRKRRYQIVAAANISRPLQAA